MCKMKRKVFSNGQTALGITLPSKWHQKYNLNKGDLLDIKEEGNSIIISIDSSCKSEKKIVSTKDLGHFIGNHVSTLYHLGYDEITFNFSSFEDLKTIKSRMPLLSFGPDRSGHCSLAQQFPTGRRGQEEPRI